MQCFKASIISNSILCHSLEITVLTRMNKHQYENMQENKIKLPGDNGCNDNKIFLFCCLGLVCFIGFVFVVVVLVLGVGAVLLPKYFLLFPKVQAIPWY